MPLKPEEKARLGAPPRADHISDEQIRVRLTAEEKTCLNRESKVRKKPMSELIRQGLRAIGVLS